MVSKKEWWEQNGVEGEDKKFGVRKVRQIWLQTKNEIIERTNKRKWDNISVQ